MVNVVINKPIYPMYIQSRCRRARLETNLADLVVGRTTVRSQVQCVTLLKSD